jgi:uncharacterized protein YmfQ (DUF2313 family)
VGALTTVTYEDLAAALLKLQPPGVIWTQETERRAVELIRGLAVELALFHNRAGVDLMDEADPDTTTEQLEDWERVTGMPRCSSIDLSTMTTQQRRDAVVAQLAAQGGQSAAYYEALAVSLGTTATVTDSAVVFEFTIDTPACTRFRAGTGQAGDPLVEFSDPVGLIFACLMERTKPAHTRINWTGP